MPSFLWTGKDSSGQEAVERVTAANAEEARDQLLARGWTNLQLRTSEIHEFVKQGVRAASNPAYRPNLTPRQELAFIQGTAPGFLARWWKSTLESGGTLLIVAFAVVAAIYSRTTSNVLLFAGLLVVVVLLFPVLHFWFRRPGRQFRELHRARTWRRWTEVLALLETLKRTQKSRKIGIGEAEMARYRALGLAGLGKLDEGIDVFTKAAEAAKMPRWLFYCHMAGLYTVAEKYESALESYRQALEVATDKGVVAIDYGSYLVQRFNRPAEARKMLPIAESALLLESAKHHVLALRGLIAMRAGDFPSAQTYMSQALAGFESHPKAKYFAYEPAILQAHGYLALIEAALGNKEAARDHFSKSEEYLQTLRLNEVIDDYQSKMAALPSLSERVQSG